MAEHTYNAHGKPTKCQCGGRPQDTVVSFPDYINISCVDCGTMLAYWRSDKFIKPEDIGVE
jgi:hypothetical protein